VKRYLHRLYAHELGYRGGYSADRRKGAGSYIYVPKEVAAEFFPPLRADRLNDSVMLPLEFPASGRISLVRYVYHNDSRLAIGTRDEYRIYLATALAHEPSLESPGNILEFLCEGSAPPRYVVRVVDEQRNSAEWRRLSERLGRSNHALEHGGFRMPPPVTGRAVDVHVTDDAMNGILQNQTVFADDDAREEGATRALREREFRESVLALYSRSCCITDVTVSHGELLNVEAAHIVPLSMRGSNCPINGLALCRDAHWAFDKGFFTITEHLVVQVHPAAGDASFLQRIAGRQIRRPIDQRALPHPDALEWHRSKVFRLFDAA